MIMNKGELSTMESQPLVNRYEIIKRSGEGGMATVYQARDTLLNRYVAIKLMKEELSKDDMGIERFLREAKMLGSLDHPNLVRIYDVGQNESTFFIVMEYVEGLPLSQKIQDKGFLSVLEAVSIAIQLCAGLAHAHEKEIIHRDLKPQNILCNQHGQYKIVDFGISSIPESTKLTVTGMVMGSVHYFSPEQAAGERVTFASDIYSLGVVLYEMLTGQVPFDADSFIALALKHVNAPVPDIRKINPDIPEELHEIILRTLAKKPEDRYQSIEELKHDLEQFLSSTQTAKKVNTNPSCLGQNSKSLRIQQKSTHPKQNQRRKVKWWIACILIMVISISSIYKIIYADKVVSVFNQLSLLPSQSNNNKKTSNQGEENKIPYPWQKEIPVQQDENQTFIHRQVKGRDGEYDVTLGIGPFPHSYFYYNTYVIDSLGSHKVLENKKVIFSRTTDYKNTLYQFHVSVPKEKLPKKEGIVKIEIFWSDNPNEKANRQDLVENLLQQWGS